SHWGAATKIFAVHDALASRLQFCLHELFHPLQDLIFRHAGGVEYQGIRSRNQRRSGTRAVPTVAFAKFGGRQFSRGISSILLPQAPLLSHDRVGVKKDFDIGIGKDFSPNIAAFHNDASADAKLLLPGNHPFAHFRMYRDSRGSVGHIGLTHALAYVATIQQHAISSERWLELDA